jgi:hypothetical protein
MHHEIFHLGSQHSCLYRLTAKAVLLDATLLPSAEVPE